MANIHFHITLTPEMESLYSRKSKQKAPWLQYTKQSEVEVLQLKNKNH